MPTPATPRHTAGPGRDGPRSSPTKPKPLDIGKSLGPHDSNSVREKVRMWQQKGGGVATIKDAQAEPDGNETVTANKREKPTTLPDARRVTTRVKPVEKITPNVNGGGIRKRSQSTPRKRVVSDQHWRSQRSPTTTSKATKGPGPNRITNYKTNESFASSSPTLSTKKAHRKDNDSEIGSGAKTDSEELKSAASASTIPKKPRAIKTTKYIYTEDGLISDHETPQTCEASKASSSIPDQEPAPSVASNLRRATPPPIDDDDWAGSEANFSELSRRRRRGQSALRETLRDARKPKSGGLLNQVLDESRKMFAKPAPPRPPPASNRGEKIAAWLFAQPDPFVDDNDDTPVEIPAPLKTRPKAARSQSRDSESEIIGSPSSGISSANGTQPIKYKVAARSDSQRRSSVDKAGEISMEKDGTSLPHKDNKTDAASGNLSRLSRRGSATRSNRLSQVARDSVQDGNHGAYINGLEDMVLPLRLRRPFPTTGIHQLSTIASEETLSSTINDRSVVGSETNVSDADNEKRDHFDPDSLLQAGSSLQRRLTKHSDLMSILSNPKSTRRSQRSSRSVRSNRTRIGTATVTEILLELSSDETKYMRELRTLVGGVIPVLLSCVLSRSDSAIAAGLFRPSADPKDDINFTRPIVDMGVALERLKTLHKRIPTDETDALLSWAQGAQRVYRDYLKAWRMGFQDVVVNLAPRDENEEEGDKVETYSLDQGMDRDESGDVVDADGEKVDVAYLLKRPLVRLKYLSKTFKGLDHAAHSPKTEQVAEIYKELVEQARRRSNEERARLEDESAAYVDSTRARSLDTLAVLPDVNVDKTRRVLARDFFSLSLIHSSGQMIDCHAELLLRDNPSGNGPGGDLLICEIDDSDRWLLFPPVERSCVSARNGDSKGEIVVMIRGHSTPDETEWQELLSLTLDDEDIGFEWVNMLGLDPVPPALPRTKKFVDRSQSRRHKAGNENKSISLAVNKMKLVLPSSSEIDVPIGEQASVISHAGKSSITNSSGPSLVSSLSEATSGNSLASDITRASDYALNNSPQTPTSPDARSTLPSAKELSDKKKLVDGKASPGLKRAKAKRRSRHEEQLTSANTTPRASPGPELETTKSPTPVSKAASRFYAGKDEQASPKLSKDLHRQENPVDNKKELLDDARVSSVPTMKMPTIPKVRKGTSNISTLSADIDNEDDDDNIWPDAMSSTSSQRSYSGDEGAPSPPPHRVSSQSPNVNSPILSPSAQRQKRRSSSPLKHEYEPSSASESSTESESSTVRHYDMGYSDSDTTDMSDEELSDNDDEIPVAHRQNMSEPPASIPALDGDTLSPSNSASQGPYRSVPSQPTKASKAVAMLFFWSDNGKWESLYPDECEIVVTPGLIEAYKFGSHISGNSTEEQSRQDRPLVALELTPLVPIRRGTAIDISIRSPPTEMSRIKSSNNVMFRSQSVDECDTLYGLINHSRINNPTYIALQNARGPYQPPSLARYNSTGSNKGTSWFGFPRRKNSYRAARHAPSIGMVSESSVGSMTSAFSALKRFGAGSKLFSIARSTVTSRTGSQDGSTVYSGPLGSSGLAAIAAAIKGADGIGLANAKIRLYVRESTTRWRDMGAARLTIMPVTPKTSRPGTAASSKSPSDVQGHEKAPRSSSHVERETGEPIDEPTADGTSTPTPGASPRRVILTQEKRILIQGKTAGEVLLDVCLGESSFERVARTGIAISVWENPTEGTIQQKGGVNGGAFRIYMIQMKSEAEAAYTFGLVGKLRY